MSARVLVVDDDEDVRGAMLEILEHAGYRVLLARDGREALAVLATLSAPCVVILDLELPDMSGEEVLRRLERDPPGCEVIVLLCSAQVYRFQDLSPRVFGCIAKPFAIATLLGHIEAALHRVKRAEE